MDWNAVGALATAAGVIAAVAMWMWDKHRRTESPESPNRPEPVSGSGASPSPPVLGPPTHATSQPSEPVTALVVSHSVALIANVSGQQIMVEAANREARPRRIVSVGFQADSGKQLVFIQPNSDRGLPCVLQETEAAHFWLPITAFDAAELHQGIASANRIRPFVRDSYDEKHFGKWSDVKAQTWIPRKAGT